MKPAAAIDPVLNVQHVSKSFGRQKVLDDVSLDMRNGETLVVLGKSGTGKTVLIRCIVRLIETDNGSIRVLGEEVQSLDRNALSELRKKVGFLFQNGALYDSMTVRENMDFPLRRIHRDLNAKQRKDLIAEALDNVGLADTAEKMPSELSGGMRKRISLARTLVVKPAIMLYDEPTSGLDPVTSREISGLIRTLGEKYRISSLLITHDMECTRSTADRVILLREGRVHAEGSVGDLEKSGDSAVKEFFT